MAPTRTLSHQLPVSSRRVKVVEADNLERGELFQAMDEAKKMADESCAGASQHSAFLFDDNFREPRFLDCTVCGKLPFRRSRDIISDDALWEQPWEWEGLADITRQVRGHDENWGKVSSDVAKSIVQTASRHLGDLKVKLVQEGLQHHTDQNYTGESATSARVVAPFDRGELGIGWLLGRGGFSSVFEVTGFHPQRRQGRALTKEEELSRHYLMRHAQLHPDFSAGKEKSMEDSGTKRRVSFQAHGSEGPYLRYAVKHLHNGMAQISKEKIQTAATDLVLEGQLLMVLDHPHIVSVRGWAAGGPEAFLSGQLSDYFLILDRLPESLEDRMLLWRRKYAKYQKRLKRRLARRRASEKICSCLRSRIEERESRDPPDMDKYEIKLLTVLLDQLKAARGIASAVAYMHSKRLIHRDLKLSNVGFDVQGDVKLFDLGLSRLLPAKSAAEKAKDGDSPADDSTHDGYVMSRVGTRFYMSPEVVRKEPYGLSADVYSFGVVLWELLSLSSPRDLYYHYEGLHARKTKGNMPRRLSSSLPPIDFPSLKAKVRHGTGGMWLPLCSSWPKELEQLIVDTMADTPADRPTMHKVEERLQQQIDHLSFRLESVRRNDEPPMARRRSTFRLDLSHYLINDPSEEETANVDFDLAEASASSL